MSAQPVDVPVGVHTGCADWSELMSDLHKCLRRAEAELRLIHMSPKRGSAAAGHLMVARVTVSQLQRWCHENGGSGRPGGTA
jgi:hypothetical protein